MRLSRLLVLLSFLCLGVQALAVVPLLSHWSFESHCESADDCHDTDESTTQNCDPSCACLGCPAHATSPALLTAPLSTGPSQEIATMQPVVPVLEMRLSLASIFRPPCR